MSVMILDLETEYHKDLPRGSSPYDPDLFIVCAGWCIGNGYDDKTMGGAWFGDDPEGEKTDWFSIPDDVQMLVGHNMAFDVQWLMQRKPEHMRAFFARGGRLFDTQLAHYLLSGFVEKYPALSEIAPGYGGSAKVDLVKAMWDQGYKTSGIPKEVLYDDYLMGQDEPYGDIENTWRVFWGQVQELQEKDMWENAMLRMGNLLYNITCMRSGLHVDRGIAEQQMHELNQERVLLMDQINAAFVQQLPSPDIPLKVTAYTMSSLLFGGYFKYEGTEPRYTSSGEPMYVKEEVVAFEDGSVCPAEVLKRKRTLAKLEKEHGPVKRYQRGKNAGEVKIEKIDTDVPAMKKCDVEVYLKGICPLENFPSEWVEDLTRNATKRTFKDGSQVFKTDKDTLEAAAKQPGLSEEVVQVLNALVRLSAIDKDLGTYYVKEDGDKVSGALQFIEDDNVIHHRLNSASTCTGRLSAAEPNMQNIPRGDTSNVKKMYTSRFNDRVWLDAALARGEIAEDVYQDCLDGLESGELRGRILEMDYAALEVVCLAALSEDQALMDALISGKDMHCMRLAKKLGEPYEDVLFKVKSEDHPDHAKYKTMRTNIKPPSFALT